MSKERKESQKLGNDGENRPQQNQGSQQSGHQPGGERESNRALSGDSGQPESIGSGRGPAKATPEQGDKRSRGAADVERSGTADIERSRTGDIERDSAQSQDSMVNDPTGAFKERP